MADRFWVGGTATWDNSTTTNWAASSGGAGGESVPGIADTVTFDASSGAGVITLNYSPSVVSITGGAHTGTFDTAGNDITVQTFSYTGAGARTLTLGDSVITVTGNATTILTLATITSLTLTANTATFDCTYSGSTGTRTIVTGAIVEASSFNVKVSAGSDALAITAASVFKALNFTGYSGTKSNTTSTVYGDLTFEGAATYTAGANAITMAATSGTKLLTSDAETLDFPINFNGTGGTFQLFDNLTIGTSRKVTLSAGTFDINGKALSAGLFFSGGGTFADVATGGSVSVTGNAQIIWSVASMSITTLPNINFTYSGSTGTRSLTNTATEAAVCNFSITAGSDIIVTSSLSSFGNLDFTGFTGTFSNGTSNTNYYGNITIPSGITSTSSGNELKLAATSGTKTITIGTTLNHPIRANGAGGTFQLGSNLTSTSNILVQAGTFTCVNGASNYILSVATLVTNGASGTLTLGSATHLLTGTGTVFNSAAGTISAFTGTLKITDTSNTAITFAGVSKVYNNLWFSRGASTASNTISGSNTFVDFKDDGTVAHSILFTFASTQIVTTFTVNGSSGAAITINSTTTATFNLTKAGGGSIFCNWLNIQHAKCLPLGTWYAVDSVNNQSTATAGTGWTFISSFPFPSFFQ